MAREVRDCEALYEALAAERAPAERRPLRRWVVSPRVDELDPDVADGLERALDALPGERVDPPPPETRLSGIGEFFELVLADMLAWHRRFDDRRDDYRYAIRARLEAAEERAMSAEEYVNGQTRRVKDADSWRDWLDEHRIDAVVEPTLPIVAPVRGHGYERPFGDLKDVSLTHFWDWTGFPVVSLPSGLGGRSGLPVGVSLIGRPGSEWDLLAWGAALQGELGVVSPP
jgi:Asp-tRNA(Asn)/Glu-tRNA(Gln) amidotransferase A subunit family amidase